MKHTYGKYARFLSHLIDQKLQEDNILLSSSQSFTLLLLIKNGGRMYQRDLEKESRVRRSSISSLIKNLEDNGYIERVDVDGDKRKKEVIITEKGIEAETCVKETIKSLEEKLVDGISKEELDLWEKVSLKMICNLEGGKTNG